MREITTHKVNPCNDRITIEVRDEPGDGGACHEYCVHAEVFEDDPRYLGWFYNIRFQDGPIPERGVNGITQEVLLAIVKDRLDGFQSGPFACEENAKALEHINAAIEVLHSRTRDRMSRGVEGTLKA